MLAIDLSLKEAAEQIGAWIGRTLVIDLLKVSADGFGASLDLCKAVDTIGGAVASSEKIVNPVLEIHPPGNVDAQHLGDHTDRKQRGKFPDEIELALAAMLPDDIINQFMRHNAAAVLHCPDPAGHERFVRQLADADMKIGRAHV